MSSPSNILILGGSGRVGQQVVADALSRGHNVTALVRKPDSLAPQTRLNLVTGSPTSSADILRALASISDAIAAAPHDPVQVTIISTLGQTRVNSSNPWSTPTSPAMYMSQSAQAIVEALRSINNSRTATPGSESGLSSNSSIPNNIRVTKFIVLSAFGTGDSWPYLNWMLRWVMAHSNMRQMIEDHNRIIEIVQENFVSSTSASTVTSHQDGNKLSIPYVVVRPVMLKFNNQPNTSSSTTTPAPPAIKEYGHGQPGMGLTLGCDFRSVSAFLLDRVGDDGRLDGTMPVISN